MIQTINNAMSKRRDAIENGENDKGFTLIELMVVIIIIGILAAIAIPAFLNQREAAWDSSIKSDISSAQIAAESFATSANGSYAGMGATASYTSATTTGPLAVNGLKVTDGNTISVTVLSGDKTYTIVGINANSTKQYTFTSTNGKTVQGTKP